MQHFIRIQLFICMVATVLELLSSVAPSTSFAFADEAATKSNEKAAQECQSTACRRAQRDP